MRAMSHSGTIEPVSLQGGAALPKHDRSESMLLHCIRAFSGKEESMMQTAQTARHIPCHLKDTCRMGREEKQLLHRSFLFERNTHRHRLKSHRKGQVQADFVRAIQLPKEGSQHQAWTQLASPLASPPPPPSPASSPPPSPPCCPASPAPLSGFPGFSSLLEIHDSLLSAPWNIRLGRFIKGEYV